MFNELEVMRTKQFEMSEKFEKINSLNEDLKMSL